MRSWYERIAEGAERAAAGVILVALAPVLGGLAAAIKATSPGPVLYQTKRVGRGGRVFLMRKFRSMTDGAPMVVSADAKTVVTEDDPRLTKIGKFLRLGFDELPQLFNVARGEMSFVGPRPDADWVEPRYTPAIRQRLEAKPGITGLAQIGHARGRPTSAGYALDVWYVHHRSLPLDLAILVATPVYVLGFFDVARSLVNHILADPRYSPSAFEYRPAGEQIVDAETPQHVATGDASQGEQPS